MCVLLTLLQRSLMGYATTIIALTTNGKIKYEKILTVPSLPTCNEPIFTIDYNGKIWQRQDKQSL